MSEDTEKLNNLITAIQNLSQSQGCQEINALSINNFKSNGYFVEFGACDGFYISNTYVLEKVFNWNGILVEPDKRWHNTINKRNCHVENKLVWSESNKLIKFKQTDCLGLSTAHEFCHSGDRANERIDGITYELETISLIDLLDLYNAPSTIDYLSIDTEGSEFEILKHFNFEKYSFNFITCEATEQKQINLISKLLISYGYAKIQQEVMKDEIWFKKLQ